MKTAIKTLTFIVAGLIATATHAVPILTNQWLVTDAAGNCSGGPHGLWTNNLNAGSSTCRNYYSFQAGSILSEYDNDTAILTATALNPDNNYRHL